MQTSQAIPIKVVFVGDGAVGKTALLKCYCTGSFPTDTDSDSNSDADEANGQTNEQGGGGFGNSSGGPFTVYERQAGPLTVHGELCHLGLWDTSSDEEMDRLRPLCYAEADVFVLCFSVAEPDSLESIRLKWSQEINFHAPRKPLVLSKCRVYIAQFFHVRKLHIKGSIIVDPCPRNLAFDWSSLVVSALCVRFIMFMVAPIDPLIHPLVVASSHISGYDV